MNSGKPRKSRTTTKPADRHNDDASPAARARRGDLGDPVRRETDDDPEPERMTAASRQSSCRNQTEELQAERGWLRPRSWRRFFRRSPERVAEPTASLCRRPWQIVAEEARIVEPPLEIAHSSGHTSGHEAADAAPSLIPKSLFRMVFVRTA